jgi:hypothetical protein
MPRNYIRKTDRDRTASDTIYTNFNKTLKNHVKTESICFFYIKDMWQLTQDMRGVVTFARSYFKLNNFYVHKYI